MFETHSIKRLNVILSYFLAQLTELFMWASQMLSVCVWILTKVASFVTAAHRDL